MEPRLRLFCYPVYSNVFKYWDLGHLDSTDFPFEKKEKLMVLGVPILKPDYVCNCNG